MDNMEKVTSERVGVIHRYHLNGPAKVCIEASDLAIDEFRLDTFEGEQFDFIENVISIVNDGREHTFETTRSIEAWKRGEANAGRKTIVIPNTHLKQIFTKPQS